MAPLRFIAAATFPLKALLVAWLLCVPLIAVMVIAGAESVAGTMFVVFGSVVALTGITMTFNINGGSDAMSQVATKQRPMGIDSSSSPLASAAYFRFFGAFATVVGMLMAFQATFGSV